MAEVVDIEPGSLRATLMAMDEPELIAQQITQQGAMHALTTLCAHGCTEQVAQDMLASLRSNMLVIEAVARDKGFARLFAEEDDAPRVPHPAEQLHEAVLAIVGELMHGDPAADSREGRLLVKLADAAEAYERVANPMPAAGVAVCLSLDGQPSHCVLWKCHEAKTCARGMTADAPASIEAMARAADCVHVDLNGDRAKALERLASFAAAVRASGMKEGGDAQR